ncbi:MAG: hypothetical protein ACRDND_34370 [Streptosporangiaceae bacterium]
METVNQKIERARAYLADIHAGHVSMADESAPFTTLTGHLEVLLGIIDDQHLAYPAPEGEQARLRAELLAEVPARDRGYALTQAVATDLSRHPGDSIVVVTRWLRDARLQGGASAAAAALTETADWIDAQLEDETASRQVIAGQASARMKTAAAQLLAAAGLDRPAGNEAGQ